MLHLVFQSSVDESLFERIGSGNAVVFLESSVLKILKNSLYAEKLAQFIKNNRTYALLDDMKIRGIAHDELINGIKTINYPELVELSVQNPLIQSWS